jgi:hypothetical protein
MSAGRKEHHVLLRRQILPPCFLFGKVQEPAQ